MNITFFVFRPYDEKMWNLDGPDGYRFHWGDFRKKPKYFTMVWGAFSSSGCFELQFPSPPMNSKSRRSQNESLFGVDFGPEA